MCSNPLDLAVIMDRERAKTFYTYFNFRRIDFIKNCSHLKLIGLRQRKVCMTCYCVKKLKMLPGPKDLMKREITGRGLPRVIESLSARDLYVWFNNFKEFSERKDVEEYLMDTPSRYRTPGLAVIIW